MKGIFRKQISVMKFCLLSPEKVKKLSTAKIVTPELYDIDGFPVDGGLMDLRLGAIDPGVRCRTCGKRVKECPGHPGSIELARPVLHIKYIPLIELCLRSFCPKCGKLTLTEEKQKEMTPIERAKKARDAKKCPHCSEILERIKLEKPSTFMIGKKRLSPIEIRERLVNIKDDEIKKIGVNSKTCRPEWAILSLILVPSVTVRPSITLDTGERSEDDLTHKLSDIIRANQRLWENLNAGAPEVIIEDLWDLLQYHVTTFFDNNISRIPPARHRSGRALKTLSQRLKGKEGRFRSNLSGKRVDFSARTVISPDPNLDIGEVGVPLAIASKLSVPEKVTQWNLQYMQQLVNNGPDKYPGALYIVRPDGKRVRLEFVIDRDKVAEAVEPGFVVERHIRDGDVVIFNRQPSLHRMSIMAHYVKVLPYKTFRLHLCVCPPYNADFDGDEMNLHVPQSEEAQTEARILMQVQDHILSPRFGGPIIGAIRDFISGAYLLTRSKPEVTYLTKKDVCELLVAAGYKGPLPDPVKTKPQSLWNGKQIFSLFLPKDLNYTLKASICQNCKECLRTECKYDAYVVIKNGELISGVIDRNSIGAEKSEGLLHRIIKDYGTNEGREFLNKISRLLAEFVSLRGMSYSYDELDLTPNARQKIQRTIKHAEKEVDKLTEELREGKLERLPGQSLDESFEIYVMDELSKAREKAGEAADLDFDMNNAGVIMTRSGARGSTMNIGQMAACLGQQSVRGKRIMRGYLDRALPHFNAGDPSPKARGFVNSSYRDGLDPVEFFFHAMGGREGLVDTAVRTQQSGYMQRRLINAMEHLRVEYDDTVRNSIGDIVQFKYGEDGVDPARSDHGKAVNVSRLVDQIELSVEKGTAASVEFINEQLEGVKDQLTPLLVRELRENLERAKLPKEGVKLAVKRTVEHYKQALVEPGEAIGIIAAQSIGEPGTQMTLRTFHYAGVKEQNVTIGLPRLIEIVDARREPSTPTMTIYLEKGSAKNLEKAKEVARRMLYTTIQDVAETLYLNPESEGVVVEFDPNKLKDRGTTIDAVFESLNLPKYSVRLEDNKVFVESKKPVASRRLLDHVSAHHVLGVSGIKRVLVMEEKGEWVIRTDGSNLTKVLEIPGVDPTRTTTNNIHEISKTLGVEAARNALISEAAGVLDEQGLDVDLRHIMLVSDIMAATGNVRQIGRHGVSGGKSSVLAKAAFEITVPNIVDAAVKGQNDLLKGVTENVIVGQSIPIGTGLVEIYMTAAQPETSSAQPETKEEKPSG